MSSLVQARVQEGATRQIKRIGMRATLRRAGVDRWCWMYFGNWQSRDLYGGALNPLDRLVIMSPEGLTTPPEHGKDALVTWVQPYDPMLPVQDELLSLTRAPERIAPSGTLIFWKLTVRR